MLTPKQNSDRPIVRRRLSLNPVRFAFDLQGRQYNGRLCVLVRVHSFGKFFWLHRAEWVKLHPLDFDLYPPAKPVRGLMPPPLLMFGVNLQ